MAIKDEVYVSVDIEADGPIPGSYSMLSLGAAAFRADGAQVGTFSVNLTLLPGAKQDPDTMAWWGQSRNKSAYEASRENTIDPRQAMPAFAQWVDSLGGTPVFVGYPAGFDFLFVYWYLVEFFGRSPFSFSALDIKTYVAATLKCGYREATKKNMPKRWFGPSKHTHVALDDAIEQGELFIAVLKENLARK